MTRPSLRRELELARTLAREAGRLILEVYATNFAVTEKSGDEGPVTEADRRANTLIVRGLAEAFPGDGIIAEESTDNADPRKVRRCWYVDPLDGTREFVARNGEFAVHVGLAVEGEARLGVVYLPVADRLYAGVVGEGCELELEGTTRELHVSSVTDPRELRLLVSRSHKSPRTDRVVELLGLTHVVACGSVGVKCGLLAEGRADLYLHPSGRSSRWDACAPEAVLRAAGGELTDLHGRPYRYDGEELRNVRGLLGSNRAARQVVRAAVDRMLRETPR